MIAAALRTMLDALLDTLAGRVSAGPGSRGVPVPWRQWLLRLFVRPVPADDPLRKLIERGASELAERLVVRQPERALHWLVRLVVQPPRPGQPDRAVLWLEQRMVAMRTRTAARLGLRPGATGAIWAWRALVRAPLDRPRMPLTTVILWLAGSLGSAWRYVLPHVPGIRLGEDAVQSRLERFATSLPAHRAVAAGLVCGALFLYGWVATTPLSPIYQALFAVCTLSLALLVRRMQSHYAILILIALSLLSSGRYIWWRLTQSLDLETTPERALGYLLVAAETYTWIILLLGYVQTAWPLRRKPVPMPSDTSIWPGVDVYIPTYNEGLDVVKPTVYAALGIDWPADRLNIYLLDDGRRAEMREFARQAGVHYMIRPDNTHAKAGNINHALKHTRGDFIAIFDCDHIPVRSFLQTTMGWFLKDPKCAMVQTPHHFFSADPFERNLATSGQVPNEGRLFYGVVQDGNDLWNAAFFCGSCAVLRRSALEAVGGVAIETVTEDAHTALKIHRRGFNTVYLKVVQAAGLATESLSGHIGQRIRWARGMAQIFRTDNPLFGRGLKLGQRLCYANAMLHFFYGIPRLIFLIAPISYLYFGLHIVQAAALTIATYVLPHIAHANIANSRIQGQYRHSFWSEVYEAVLAWYVTLPTTVAFINPRYGKFNVTAKGGVVQENFFDWSISRPYLVLLALNVSALVVGIVRLFGNGGETGTILLNLAWVLFNLGVLGAAVAVATEVRQVRRSHRVAMDIPVVLYLRDGRAIACQTADYSTGGLGLVLGAPISAALGTEAWAGLRRGDREFCFPVRLVMNRGVRLGVEFAALTTEQEKQLVQCTFGRADAWCDWDKDQPADAPLKSLRTMLDMGVRGYCLLLGHLLMRVAARWQARRAAAQAQP